MPAACVSVDKGAWPALFNQIVEIEESLSVDVIGAKIFRRNDSMAEVGTSHGAF